MPPKVAPKKSMRTLTDGDVLLFERQIGAVDYAEGQQRKYDVKQQPNLIKRFLLHVEVDVTLGSLGPITYLDPLDFPYNMITNIQVRTSQGLVLKNFSAIQIDLLNRLEFFTPSLNTAPTDIDTSLSFEFDVIIPFEDHTGLLPERCILNTNQYNDLTLFVTWANLDDILGGTYDSNLDTFNVNCTVVSCERPPVDRNDELMARQQMIDTISNGSFGVDSMLLPENTMVKTLMVLTYGADGGPRVNTQQDNIRVTYDSGQRVLRDMSWGEIQSQNKSYYHVEAIDVGVATIEFDQMRDFKTLFRTKNRNYARIEFTPAAGAGGTIRVFRRRIATPKIITL